MSLSSRSLRSMMLAVMLATTSSFMPSQATAQSVPAAVAACAAQPEICAIAAAGIGAWYVLWRNQAPTLCTWGGCEVLQKPPRSEMRAEQEVHGAVSESGCYAMAARFKKAGRSVKLVRIRKVSSSSSVVLKYDCIFEGKDARPGWYGS